MVPAGTAVVKTMTERLRGRKVGRKRKSGCSTRPDTPLLRRQGPEEGDHTEDQDSGSSQGPLCHLHPHRTPQASPVLGGNPATPSVTGRSPCRQGDHAHPRKARTTPRPPPCTPPATWGAPWDSERSPSGKAEFSKVQSHVQEGEEKYRHDFYVFCPDNAPEECSTFGGEM